LGEEIIKLGFLIGIVSASPKEWMDVAINRISFKDGVKVKLSLFSRPDLRHKPAPDGYLEAINELKTTPEATIILEDSNMGIASAKAAGAYTIGLQQNLIAGYTQQGADTYAKNLEEVARIIKVLTFCK
jgi:beta-phosphoglucomutase-like phosphatase (HAD superfamily)